MSRSFWRMRAREIVHKTIQENPGLSAAEYEKILRPLYPWGERINWPYKAWRLEVRLALGKDQPQKPETDRIGHIKNGQMELLLTGEEISAGKVVRDDGVYRIKDNRYLHSAEEFDYLFKPLTEPPF
jgi:hypothetical protein